MLEKRANRSPKDSGESAEANLSQPSPNSQLHLSGAKYGSDAIVDLLKAVGVEYIAFNPGATFRELQDSIVNYGGNRKPEVVLCCHEQVAVDIAHGYNMVAAKPMMAIVHDLVGLLNASMSIYNAWVDRAPVVILGATGPLAIEARRPWIDWIHTANSQGEVVRDYVKWDDQAITLPGAFDSILRGYQLSMTEPKGPVYISLDRTLQAEALNSPVQIPDVRRYACPAPPQGNTAELQRAAELLVEAERPVVVADYLGASPDAVNSLAGLADLLALPVIDRGYMFNFPSDHPMNFTGAEVDLLRDTDLILSLGVFDLYQALTSQDSSSGLPRPAIPDGARIIDISLRHFAVKSWVQDYGKLQPTDLSISASPGAAVPVLSSLCREIISRRGAGPDNVRARFQQLEARRNQLSKRWSEAAARTWDQKPISRARIASELRQVVNDKDWVLINNARDAWVRRLWKIQKPYQYVGGQTGGGLGFGIGRALGTALAHRSSGRLCIDLQPDGDLLYLSSGLWTAAHSKIPLLIVVYNNRSYFNSERHQQVVASGRSRPVENAGIGTRIEGPAVHFAKLAGSFGVYSEGPIEETGDLRGAFERAVEHVCCRGEAALVDVVIQRESGSA